MSDARPTFHEELKALEHQALAGVDLIADELNRASEAVAYQDAELAGLVVAGHDLISSRYLETHHQVLSLIARQAPVAVDLRVIAAILNVIRCTERIGDQCVNAAKLVPLSGYESPRDREILEAIERMGRLAHAQVAQAKMAFATRDVLHATDLAHQDEELNLLNRTIFRRAVDIGDDIELREWAMLMTLVARAFERVGDNAVDIAEQVVFVVTGLFRATGDGCNHVSASRSNA